MQSAQLISTTILEMGRTAQHNNSGVNHPNSNLLSAPPNTHHHNHHSEQIDESFELSGVGSASAEKVVSVTESALSQRSSVPLLGGSATHHPLDVNPAEHLNKAYIASLRRFQMGHCDRNQVLYRLRNMGPDTLLEFARDLVEMVETFGEQYDQLKFPVQPKESTPSGEQRSLIAANSTASRSPALSTGDASRGGHRTVLLSDEFPLLPGHKLYDPKTASFASMMTTNSIASMDPRPPVNETTQLLKSEDVEGNKVINKYTVIGELGKGAYGKVKLGINNEINQSVAIKIIRKSILKKSADPTALNREIAILKKVNHRNTVKLYEVIDDPASDKLYLIMQYVPNGPIVKVRNDCTCQPMAESIAKICLKQLLSGVRYLHKRGIIHRDIKPDNILVGQDHHVLIADFGVSEFCQKSSLSFSRSARLGESRRGGGAAGTPLFLPPETVCGDPTAEEDELDMQSLMESLPDEAAADAKQTAQDAIQQRLLAMAADVWALGITMWLVLVGAPPFEVNKGYMETVRAISEEPFVWPAENTVGSPLDPRWGNLLEGMLNKDPNARWSLKRVKNHPVFLDVDYEDEIPLLARLKMPEVTSDEVNHATTTCRMFMPDDASVSKSLPVKVRAVNTSPRHHHSRSTSPLANTSPSATEDGSPSATIEGSPLADTGDSSPMAEADVQTAPSSPQQTPQPASVVVCPNPSDCDLGSTAAIGTVAGDSCTSVPGNGHPATSGGSANSDRSATPPRTTSGKPLCPSPPTASRNVSIENSPKLRSVTPNPDTKVGIPLQ